MQNIFTTLKILAKFKYKIDKNSEKKLMNQKMTFGSVCLLDDALEQIAQYNVNL